MLLVNNESKLIQGHVLDSSKRGVESALQFYDKQLYLKWNCKKLNGYGCWELRRRPEFKKITEIVCVDNLSIAVVAYKEYDWVHHVKDFPYCNYKIVEWVKDNDLFTQHESEQRNGLLGKVIEDNLDARIASNEKKLQEEQDYLAQHTKSEWRGVMQEMNSGKSLASALIKRGF